MIRWNDSLSAHVLIDNNSANGLFINGTRARKGGSIRLKEGDVITFGKGDVTKGVDGRPHVATTEFAYMFTKE